MFTLMDKAGRFYTGKDSSPSYCYGAAFKFQTLQEAESMVSDNFPIIERI